jgi:hypothetical protein
MYLSWAPGFHPVIPGEIELDNGRDPAIKHFWHLGRNRRNERQRRKAAGPPNQQLHGA